MRSVWKVSLHGGHSQEFCEHAAGSLQDMLEAAVNAGYHTFGVSEHAPRVEERFLYESEIAKGWTPARTVCDFESYAGALDLLVKEFADRLVVLRGFETEVVPADRYVELTLGYRERFRFDYMVGSVHHVDEVQIDGSAELYRQALKRSGGLEPLVIRYYQTVVEMVEALKPEVVAHLDVISKNAKSFGPVNTPAIRRIAEQALEVIREHDCILDLNTAGYRKGLGTPYPASWLVRLARRMGIGFCFGDDSHAPGEVGAGLDEARLYLLENGVSTVTILTHEGHELARKIVPIEA